MRQIRLLQESQFRDGAGNMAVDCAIAEAVADGQPPTLRLYGWRPFCLSLGYGQRARDVDLPALRARRWDLVRRPTGGKAILHGDELTYSFCLPLQHPLAQGNIVESYRRISAGLVAGLARLGLAADANPLVEPHTLRSAGPVCFDLPSHYEITLAGRKVIGSAQLRRRGVLLQHGTIPLIGDLTRICDVLNFESESERAGQKRELSRRAATLAEFLARAPSWADVAAALTQGFATALDLTLTAGELSPAEAERAAELKSQRFADEAYTFKR